MQIIETSLPGILRLEPHRFGDARGWFSETWNAGRMAEAGLAHDWVQDNQSFSATKGTVRGLHYQAPPSAQAKWVRVVAGAVLDVAADGAVRFDDPDLWVDWGMDVSTCVLSDKDAAALRFADWESPA